MGIDFAKSLVSSLSPPIPGKVQALSLRANFSFVFFGNSIYALSQWVLIAVTAKFGSAAMLGDFSLALAVAAPIILFAQLNLRAAQATDTRLEFEFADYLRVRVISLGLALLIITVALAIAGQAQVAGPAILLVAGTRAVESFSDLVYGHLQQQERMDRIATSLSLRGILQCGVFALIIRAGWSLHIGLAALAACSAAVLLFHDLPLVTPVLRRRAPALSSTCRRLIAMTLPLGFAAVLDSLMATVPRYFVAYYCGSIALGYYAGIASLMLIGHMLVGALADAARPRLAKLFLLQYCAFIALLRKLIFIALLIGTAAIATAFIAGAPILSLAFRPDFGAQVALLRWIMLAATLWYVSGFLYSGLVAARLFTVQAPIFGVSMLGTMVASYLLVPGYGLIGAALALTIGLAIRALCSALALSRALAQPH